MTFQTPVCDAMQNQTDRLGKVRDYIIQKYAPIAVLLHGSRLCDGATESSDYDLVIVTSSTDSIYPHQYEDMMLDIEAVSTDMLVIKNSNKVPTWPLKILHDTNDIAKKICAETEKAYKNGPSPLSDQEWRNRSSYTKRLIDKIHARGSDTAVRHYYMADLYMRVIRYWFEKKDRWTVPPYRALPIIQNEDPEFYKRLQNLWAESYFLAIDEINRSLFD